MKSTLLVFLLKLFALALSAQCGHEIVYEEQEGRKVYFFKDAEGRIAEKMGRCPRK